MINGAHAIVFSTDAEADRSFLRDVLALPHVDVGGGWLIFGLPPAEVAVHPADGNGGSHELYLMCENVEQLRERLSESNIESSDVSDVGWGLVTQVTLPGGSKIGIYQPRHARPEQVTSSYRGDARPRGAAAGAGAKKKKAKGKAVKKAPAKPKKAVPKAAPKAKKAAKKKAGKRRGG